MFLNAKLETDRLIIRPYKIEDIDQTYAVVSEKDFYQYIPEEIPDREGVRKIIEWSITQNQKNTADKIYKFNLAIIHKEDGKIIGYCGLGPDDLGMGETEIYYGISSQYRKQGLALEAAKATLEYGFEVIGLKKIMAFADYRNLPSLKILENLGMKYHFRISHLQEELSDFEGQCYYSLTAEEYLKSL
ncbi:GNAT family N-acetyltransferase [Ureibacillus acetophenoni]|uniref:Ribosomal-protein-alanine N-acetyltransferase n=1 Tax=Ureibacillus acetophenoni TaxID=614649 RepID=A0A285UNE3_9BACL|nr:GNAT family N-acetyltransferase [Ureibacillus acetophenoni]SOC43237.1 ribosomal-protein-alanine N-acetyltransferase [Ureibacillus acetophenoni]